MMLRTLLAILMLVPAVVVDAECFRRADGSIFCTRPASQRSAVTLTGGERVFINTTPTYTRTTTAQSRGPTRQVVQRPLFQKPVAEFATGASGAVRFAGRAVRFVASPSRSGFLSRFRSNRHAARSNRVSNRVANRVANRTASSQSRGTSNYQTSSPRYVTYEYAEPVTASSVTASTIKSNSGGSYGSFAVPTASGGSYGGYSQPTNQPAYGQKTAEPKPGPMLKTKEEPAPIPPLFRFPTSQGESADEGNESPAKQSATQATHAEVVIAYTPGYQKRETITAHTPQPVVAYTPTTPSMLVALR